MFKKQLKEEKQMPKEKRISTVKIIPFLKTNSIHPILICILDER
jgi:hypothetical protein